MVPGSKARLKVQGSGYWVSESTGLGFRAFSVLGCRVRAGLVVLGMVSGPWDRGFLFPSPPDG